MNKIYIIGGGVSGLTTGILLNLYNYNTKIITENLPYSGQKVSKNENHSLATNYAAASVKPSTINESRKTSINRLFSISNRVFNTLESNINSISKQNHYVLYSSKKQSLPSYTNFADNTRRLNPQNNLFKDYDKEIEDGFLFDCYFVNMPDYIPWLISKYKETGGKIEYKRVSDIESFSETVVNCTGYWSRKLLQDESVVAKRGHLLKINNPIRLKNNSRTFSYSYSLKNDNFIYGYPRKNSLLLGGTSEIGTPDPDEQKWSNTKPEKFISINGDKIPKHIYNENKKLLSDVLDIDISKYDNFSVLCGYRPFRRKGLRVEEDKDFNSLYHNYGHGGAGVTLSYGCAYKILNLISEQCIELNDLYNKIKNIT